MRLYFAALFVYCLTSTAYAGQVRFFSPVNCAQALDEPSAQTIKDDYEFKVAEEFLKRCRHPGDNVILASRFGDWDVPAFDAVLVDAAGLRLANISIKGIRISGDNALVITDPSRVAGTLLRLIKRANRKIKVWSEEPAWDRWTKYSRPMLAERVLERPMSQLAQKKVFLDAAVELFSIPFSTSGVRTQIVIAITDAVGEPMPISDDKIPRKAIRHIISGHPGVEAVVIVRDGAPMTITGRYRAHVN